MTTATQNSGTMVSRIQAALLRRHQATVAELAKELGTKRSTLGVYLSQLKRRGVLQLNDGQWSLAQANGGGHGAPTNLGEVQIVVGGHAFSAHQARSIFEGLADIFGSR